jgi:RNA polymerase sigma factor (sigma-70 family)
MYTELELIAGLKERDLNVMKHLYANYYPMIRDLIQKNGGSEDDAADIFQEGMVVLYQKSQDHDFTWSSTLKTFLYAVCKNKWLMQLRKKRKSDTVTLEDSLEISSSVNVQNDLIMYEKKELMRTHFSQLGADCQEVLRRFFDGDSLRQIAEVMNFTEAYAKKRKFICQQRLIQAISADPIYNELSTS